MLILVATVLNTGAAGPDLIRKKNINSAWHFYIRPVQNPRPLDTSKRVKTPCGLFHLTVRIEEFQARVPFLVVQNIAVGCLLAKSCVDHHVKAILPRLQKVLFYRSCSTEITGQRSRSQSKISLPFAFEDQSRKYRQRGK